MQRIVSRVPAIATNAGRMSRGVGRLCGKCESGREIARLKSTRTLARRRERLRGLRRGWLTLTGLSGDEDTSIGGTMRLWSREVGRQCNEPQSMLVAVKRDGIGDRADDLSCGKHRSPMGDF